MNTAEELSGLRSRRDVAKELEELRAAGEVSRVVLANGCFEVLHPGHVRYLRDSRSRGDFLVVALNTDESVRGLKGEGRPLQSLADRAEVVGALACVDRVVAFEESTLEATLRLLRPDVHAKGTDYNEDNLPEREVDRELGIEIAICGDPKERSSTGIIERARSL